MRQASFKQLFSILAVGLLAQCPALALAQSATIEGTVTDSGSSGIAGATVAASTPGGGGGVVRATGTTEPDGSYSISIDMAAGESLELVVEAAGPNHAPARHGWSNPLPCFFSCDPGGEIVVNEGDTITNVDISLDAGGNITGAVTAADSGSPLEAATVRMTRADSGSFPQYFFTNHFWGVADGSGNYTTPLALPDGDYHLLAHPPSSENYVVKAWDDFNCQLGNGCPVGDTDVITVAGSTSPSGIDFSLQPGATLEGTLLPDDIQRTIRLYDGSGKLLGQSFIASFDLPEDQWSFTGLSGGSYYLELGPFSGENSYLRILHNGLLCPFAGCNRARGTPITIYPGSSLSLASIDLPLGGQVEGTIVDADTGSSPAGVPSGAQLGFFDVIEADGTVVGGGSIAEDDGQVVLHPSSGLPTGDYYVRTYHDWLAYGIGYEPTGSNDVITGYADAAYPDVACAGRGCDLPAASTISISESATTNIQIEIATGSNISGRVTDEDTSAGVENVVVKLIDADNEMLAATLTDDNGDYHFGAFPAGSYYVRTAAAGRFGEGHFGVQNAYFDKVYGATDDCSELLCDPSGGTAVTLDGSSDATGIDMEIAPGPVISGQIIDAITGLPINRGRIEVYNDSGQLVGEYRLATHLDARYQTTALPPGTYTLVPNVSPAYSSVSTSSGSTPTRLAGSGAPEGLEVTIGTGDVEADLQIVDQAIDRLFNDDFSSPN